MKRKIAGWGIIFSLLLLTVTLQNCDKEVYVEPNSINLGTDYTRIYVASNPPGATIYVNGKTTGLVTPDTVRWLLEGDYPVTLKKKYFWDTTFTIQAINNKTTNGYVDYYQSERMLGKINCTSNPAGAKIYVDNVFTEKYTPSVISRLLPKVYSVKYEYPEYRKDSADVTVTSSCLASCGLTLEDTLDVVTYNMTNSKLPSNDIKCIAEDKEGNMWFGTSAEGLLKFDGKKFYHYNTKNTGLVSSDYVRRMVKDKENNLWIGFSNGLVKYNGINWQTIPTSQVYSLKVSPDNTIIAALELGGILEYSSGNIKRTRATENGLSTSDVISACRDKEGTLWAGLFVGDMDQYTGTAWNHLTAAKNGLPAVYNNALEIDADGTLFGIFHAEYGMNPSVLHSFAKYTDGKWSVFYTNYSVVGFDNIYVDDKNKVWFSLGGSIFRITDKTSMLSITRLIHSDIRRFTGNALAILTYGTEVYVDSKENLWIIGGTKGLIKIKKGRWDY